MPSARRREPSPTLTRHYIGRDSPFLLLGETSNLAALEFLLATEESLLKYLEHESPRYTFKSTEEMVQLTCSNRVTDDIQVLLLLSKVDGGL